MSDTQNHSIVDAAGLIAALDDVPDGLITCDMRGIIQSASQSAARMFGFSAKELISQNVSVLMDPEQGQIHNQHIASYLGSGRSTIVGAGREVSGRRKDGTMFPLYVAVGHLRIGEEHMFAAVLQDRTNEHLIRERLHQARRLAEEACSVKSEFVANVSHELRTPLHIILSHVRFGLDDVDRLGCGELREHFEIIHRSGMMLLELVNDLLDLDKLESRKMFYDQEVVDLRMVVGDTIAEFATLLRELGTEVELTVPGQGILCEADLRRLTQVVRNLLANAIKFSPPGSAISVELTPANQMARLSVHDRGPGVPEDELDEIFSKFTQSSRTRNGSGGTGLGLAICREIIKDHGGEMWAENRLDGGASFHASLPLCSRTACEIPACCPRILNVSRNEPR